MHIPHYHHLWRKYRNYCSIQIGQIPGHLLASGPVPVVAADGGPQVVGVGEVSGAVGQGQDGEDEEEGGDTADVGEEVPGQESSSDVAEEDPCCVEEGWETGQSSSVLGSHSLCYEDADTGHCQAHPGPGDCSED